MIANGLHEFDDEGYSTPDVLGLMATHVKRLEALDHEERKELMNVASAQDHA